MKKIKKYFPCLVLMCCVTTATCLASCTATPKKTNIGNFNFKTNMGDFYDNTPSIDQLTIKFKEINKSFEYIWNNVKFQWDTPNLQECNLTIEALDDSSQYTGFKNLTLTYNIVNRIDIGDIEFNTNLTYNFSPLPSEYELTTAFKSANAGLINNWTNIELTWSNITTTSSHLFINAQNSKKYKNTTTLECSFDDTSCIPIGIMQFDYNSSNHTYTLSGFTKSISSYTKVIIPSTFNDGIHGTLNVTKINGFSRNSTWSKLEWGVFRGSANLLQVEMPPTIIEIGLSTFEDCTNLNQIIWPSNLENIGSEAFSRDTSLQSLCLPDSLTSIGQYAFYGCSNISSISLPNSIQQIGSFAFFDCKNINDISLKISGISNPTYKLVNGTTGNFVTDNSFQTNAFLIRSSDTNTISATTGTSGGLATKVLTIPSSINGIMVENIGAKSFMRTSTQILSISNGIKQINDQAFEGCSILSDITFSSSVESIGASSFKDCRDISSLILPDSLTSIGSSAFYNCSNVSSVSLPNSIQTIGSYAFYNCESIEEIALRQIGSITTPVYKLVNGTTGNFVTDNSFQTNAFLIRSSDTNTISATTGISGGLVTKVLTIPPSINGVTIETLGSNSFSSTSVETISFSNNITSISSSAFSNCLKILNLYLPDSLTSIGSSAFSSCSNISSISLSNATQTILDYAFSSCENINTLQLRQIDDIVDPAYKLVNGTNGNFVTDNSFQTNAFLIRSSDTNTISATTGTRGGLATKVLTIPSSINGNWITRIGSYSFYQSSVTNLNFQNINSDSPLHYIDQYSFASTSLNQIILPVDLYGIGKSAFSYTNIESIELNTISSIGDGAFYGCKNLNFIHSNYNITWILDIPYWVNHSTEIFKNVASNGRCYNKNGPSSSSVYWNMVYDLKYFQDLPSGWTS